MRLSLLKQGIVQGALAERGIEDKFVESCLDGVIVQRLVAQMGWVRKLVILQCFMPLVAIKKYCKELGL